MIKKLQHLAEYGFVRLLIAVAQTLPEDRADAICRHLAVLFSDGLRIRHATVDGNLRRVYPEKTEAERAILRRQMWHHLLLMLCEIAWAPRRLHRCNWRQHFRFIDAPTLLRVLLSRRPAVLVTGHFGNFELGGYVTGLMGIRTMTIARTLDNPYLHAFLGRFRGAKMQRMVDKNGCAPEIERHLGEGGKLALLADQYGGAKGCWVDFLGHQASCHKALALFTLTADAPMLVAYTRRSGGPMQFEQGSTGIVDPRDSALARGGVRPLTEWYNERLGVAIQRDPDQYWWLHRRWRAKPKRVRRPPAEAAPEPARRVA